MQACPPESLETDVLARYCFCAFTTMGDEKDFLYFAPRMFTLYATDAKWHGYEHLLLQKTWSGGLAAASPQERQTLQHVVNCLWRSALSDHRAPVNACQHALELCRAGYPFVRRELAAWKPEGTRSEVYAILEFLSAFPSFPEDVRTGLIEWLRNHDVRALLSSVLQGLPADAIDDVRDVGYGIEDIERLLDAHP